MTEEMQAGEPIEGEYTDSELPVDAEVPKDAVADRNDGDWDGDDDEVVVVEEVDVVVFEDDGEYTDTDVDGDRRDLP